MVEGAKSGRRKTRRRQTRRQAPPLPLPAAAILCDCVRPRRTGERERSRCLSTPLPPDSWASSSAGKPRRGLFAAAAPSPAPALSQPPSLSLRRRLGDQPARRPPAMPSSPLRVAVVCSSNQNRSMEAHNILSKRGFSVRSFGTGTHVKLPGPAPDKPNVYDFKTTYDQMYNDLLRKDKELYTQNGILHMLDRNKRIKPRPERFQNCKDVFDLILTCEERVYDQVVEDLNSRDQETCQPVHVINVDIQDNHEEATLGAFLICELCQCIQHTEDMENEIDELLQEFEEKSGRTFLHTVCFY
uniref:RNA polymerase II subunit A C-terminal domain phosphatase SSU72 n=1 Tax=Salvator merianae TaxID=96440 RepID=A0A8D0BY78_SALMN